MDEWSAGSPRRRRLIGGLVAPLATAACVAAGLLSLGAAARSSGGLTAPALPPADLVAAMITRMQPPDRSLLLRESELQNLRAVARVFGTPAEAAKTLVHLHWLAGAVRAWVSRSGDDNVREHLWLFSSSADAQTFHRDYLAANEKTARTPSLAVLRRTGATVFESGGSDATLVLHRDRFVVLMQIARHHGHVSETQLVHAARAAANTLASNS